MPLDWRSATDCFKTG